jgi:hypothetical protein
VHQFIVIREELMPQPRLQSPPYREPSYSIHSVVATQSVDLSSSSVPGMKMRSCQSQAADFRQSRTSRHKLPQTKQNSRSRSRSGARREQAEPTNIPDRSESPSDTSDSQADRPGTPEGKHGD